MSNRKWLVRTVALAASLSGLLLLEGCGRAGAPLPLDPNLAAKIEPPPATEQKVDPTTNLFVPYKPPRGFNDNALKAGASKDSTPFDFLL